MFDVMTDALAKWNFEVEVAPVYGPDGKPIDERKVRGIYRTDTGQCLASCGPHYKPIQNAIVLDGILEKVEKDGYDIHISDGDHTQRQLYDIVGKKGVIVKPQLNDEGGAVLRVDMIFGDFTEVKGAGARSQDILLAKATALNSHDQSLSAQVVTGTERVICLNGMTRMIAQNAARAKHTLHVDIEALQAKIAMGVAAMADDTERFELYARTKVTVDQAAHFFRTTIARLSPTVTGEEQWSRSLVETLLMLFDKEGMPTLWGVINAMTAWSTHGERRANANALTTKVARESRVARAMQATEFEDLLAA